MPYPTFSICIPNYNYAKYLGQTIQSVLQQTYPHFEIIIADNASTDHSVAVVESFNDDRIRLVQNRWNIGFAPNLQRATMYARNDFINLLSSDDVMKATALETYARLIQNQEKLAETTVLISQAEVINAEGKPTGRLVKPSHADRWSVMPSPAWMELADKERIELHRGKSMVCNTIKTLHGIAPFLSVVYPRSMWSAIEGYNSIHPVGPDTHFHYKLFSLDPEVIYVKEPLFQYRVHGSPNQQSQVRTILQQLDEYLYTVEYSNAALAELGTTRKELIVTMLDRCLKAGLTQLVHGSYGQAFRMQAFSFASYPLESLKRPRTYALGVLLMLGPVGKLLARPLYYLYRRVDSRQQGECPSEL